MAPAFNFKSAMSECVKCIHIFFYTFNSKCALPECSCKLFFLQFNSKSFGQKNIGVDYLFAILILKVPG